MTIRNIVTGAENHDTVLVDLEERIEEMVKEYGENNIISISHSIVYNPVDSGTSQSEFGKWIGTAILTIK